MKNRGLFILGIVTFGYAFLYIPLLSIIVYSFNDSRLVTLWGGFSLRWYGVLFQDGEVLAAAWLSLKIATITATVSMVFGTLMALGLNRLGRFRGRTLLTTILTGLLVLPEIIFGISVLFLFVSMSDLIGWPSARGATTITIAHITFATGFAAVVIRTRLGALDQSLEEAAMDLGARPLRTFFDITVPAIAPAMIAGWLLAFTLSLDDVVTASFVSGPGSTTLPMLIFSKVRLGVTPDVNALATVIIVLVSVGVVAAAIISRKKSSTIVTTG